MKVLAIDTANYVMGVALLDEQQVVGEIITNVKKNHSVRLMPAIEQLLKECDTKPSDLEKNCSGCRSWILYRGAYWGDSG
ncbi:hypothetical protein GCM10020331_016430 [Ectobacillus funiculus]